MPIYRLWRQSDNTTFDDVEARDDAHAVAIYSRQISTALTLENGPAAPEYMMGRIPKEVGWSKPLDIPVWVKETTPSK